MGSEMVVAIRGGMVGRGMGMWCWVGLWGWNGKQGYEGVVLGAGLRGWDGGQG